MKDVKVNPDRALKNYRKKLDAMNDRDQQRFTAYLYIIFSLITLTFFGIFAIRPTLSTISKLNRQYEDGKVLHNALLTKSGALRNLDIQYNQLEPDLQLIYLAVPKSTRMAQVTRQIETIAKNNSLILNELTFATVELYPATKDNPSLYSFTFNATLEGNEENVKTFITDVIQFDRLINIEQLNTGNRETGEYGITLTGKAYFSKN